MVTETPAPIKRIIEAALLASSQPLSVARLGALFTDDMAPTAAEISAVLHGLQADAEGRGVELVEVASGFRYQVRQDCHPWVARLWTERQSRYSRALLETLALIAYRQPVTRGEIEQVRGVAVSSSIVHTLEEREWIRVVGYRDTPGKPALYGTTKAFLDYFNLQSLDQLPTLTEVHDLESFDPELAFRDSGNAIPARVGREPEVPDEAAAPNVDTHDPQPASEPASDDDHDTIGATERTPPSVQTDEEKPA